MSFTPPANMVRNIKWSSNNIFLFSMKVQNENIISYEKFSSGLNVEVISTLSPHKYQSEKWYNLRVGTELGL